jgi:hypothetical protein
MSKRHRQVNGGVGVLVPASPGFPRDRRVKQEIAFASNDTRATPIINMMAQTPAKVGASTHGWLEGTTAGEQPSVLYVQVISFQLWSLSFRLFT